MSKFFIHRPIFAIVIAIIIVIVGVLAAMQLPISQYPKISPPRVVTYTTYTGANSSVVNDTIAQVVEQQVNGTQGMDYMSSNSDDTGRYTLMVTFNVGTDGDMDAVKVQNNVAIANASLPTAVQTYGVTTRKTSQDMAIMFALSSPDNTYDRAFMKTYGDIYMVDKIKRVNGVGDVQIFGADYAMRIWLNPDRMAELKLTMAEVTAAITEQNMQAPAGTVGAMPVDENQEKQYTGTIQGRINKPEQFGDIIIRSSSNGSFIRLKDIARIETGQRTMNILSKVDGVDCVGFGVQLTSDANAIETVGEVRKILNEAVPDLPPGLEYTEIMDSTDFINASIKEVLHTFIEALLLVVLVIFIFLQSWRATIIPVLAVPVSLIGTFASFIILGFSINTLTLFAMVLAIGLVVDDAIVVIENVEHHMRYDDMDPTDATERAMDEVQGPVVAIAFVLAAVFVPVAFLGGMMGVLYRQFALTIAVSMAISAFVALTLTPALCAMILKPRADFGNGTLDRFFVAFNRWFEATRDSYTGVVGRLLNFKKIALVFIIIVCIGAAAVFKIMPSTFVPDEDQGYFLTSVTMPEGTSLNRTQEVADRLAAVAMEKIPGVQHVMDTAGFDILSFGAKSNAAMIVCGLKDWSQRPGDNLSVTTGINTMFGLGAMVAPEATVIAFNPPPLPGLGMVGGWSMRLMDMSGHTDEELHEISQAIVSAANQRPELVGVRSNFNVGAPIYNYEVDREKVKNLGINLSEVFAAMQINFGGMQVNDFNAFGRTYKVMMQSDTRYRSVVDSTKFIFVKTASGSMVPLNTLLKPRMSSAPTIISRFNATRAVSILGNARDGYSSGQAMQAITEVVKEVAPQGFGIEWADQSREEIRSGNKTLQVLALALVFVFLCLAALYESWSVPFAVLFTVPIGIFGALVSEYGMSILEAMDGFRNAGLQNSLYMQIGIIMLIGLAAKNAILIVEFAKVRVDKGMDVIEAAKTAAGLRLRPILMTSFAFIIGCIPLAVATGAGAAARNGMGVAVVGGMLFATAFGIFMIPVFYVITEVISSKLGIRKKKQQHRTEDFM